MTDVDAFQAPQISFNDLLRRAGFDPKSVRLMRHKDKDSLPGRSLYELWRDTPHEFERYQSHQSDDGLRNSAHWASFVVTPQGETLFVGLYDVRHVGPTTTALQWPTNGKISDAGEHHIFEATKNSVLAHYEGRIVIDWGRGYLAWCQYADRNDKAIVELKKAHEDPFPGYLKFISNFSRIETLPQAWIDMLRIAKGVYVLTCPRDQKHYVGSAYGENGFFGRWTEEARNGHGGNIQLIGREPSDFQVSILEVAGSAMTDQDIQNLESHWKNKLQSREIGLNSN